MPNRFKPIDLSAVKTYSISKRKSKVTKSDFASTWKKGGLFSDFIEKLPNILAGSDIKSVIEAVAVAFKKRKTVVFGMGAHVIKSGLSPVIIDLMERGIITAVAMNGAGIIHDFEIAMAGQTSEDVDSSITDGTFGMARETCSSINSAIKTAGRKGRGLGESVGMSIIDMDLPFAEKSILAAGIRFNVPVTVHVAIGTDIIHMHPDFDPESAGQATYRDFKVFASIIGSLEQGVYFNAGSAVILPEVFLKALTLARNTGHTVKNITTVNIDFIRQYRPLTNVINRPTSGGGQGIQLIGHHEIIIPMLAAAIIEKIEGVDKVI